MSSSFSIATRQHDDGYEYSDNAAASTTRAHRDYRYINSGIDPNRPVGNHVGGGNPFEAARHFGEREPGLLTNDIGSDRYSYRRPSYSRSEYPVPVHTRRGHAAVSVYRNDSIRFTEDTLTRGTSQGDVPIWEDSEICHANFAFTPANENFIKDSFGRKSFVEKPSSRYRSDYYQDDLARRRSSRYEVQPGFQRVQYDDEKAFSTPKKQPEATMIEVSPGEFLRLRGADETWRAIHHDFYVPCACLCCELTLFCIQDAVLVLCPQCMIVSPLEGVAYDGHDGGVGMGFTMESLAKWQEEIINKN